MLKQVQHDVTTFNSPPPSTNFGPHLRASLTANRFSPFKSLFSLLKYLHGEKAKA